MLKAALRPIAAGQRVELAADGPDKLQLGVRIGAWVGVGPGQVLVKMEWYPRIRGLGRKSNFLKTANCSL